MVTENTALADDSDYSEEDIAIFSGVVPPEVESSIDEESNTAPSTDQLFNKSVAPVKSRPGRMLGDVTITLHTLQAHQMFLGRRVNNQDNKPAITGMLRFAKMMNMIWIAASHDDPYADYILFDIEQSLNVASEFINEKSEEMTQKLDKLKERGYNISLRESSKPMELSLRFAPEFTHKAAIILLDFDYLMRQSLSLKHAASMNMKEFGFVKHQCRKLIRAAFESSLRFRQTNVTRNDMAANNPVAQKAKNSYNFEVPQQILEGIIRAEICPHISTPRK